MFVTVYAVYKTMITLNTWASIQGGHLFVATICKNKFSTMQTRTSIPTLHFGRYIFLSPKTICITYHTVSSISHSSGYEDMNKLDIPAVIVLFTQNTGEGDDW
jgi:hypothetical protein